MNARGLHEIVSIHGFLGLTRSRLDEEALFSSSPRHVMNDRESSSTDSEEDEVKHNKYMQINANALIESISSLTSTSKGGPRPVAG